MGYSTRNQVENILASALTRGTNSDTPVEIINVGREVRDTVLPETFIQYIRWADETIDAALSVIYKVPLRRVTKGEYEIFGWNQVLLSMIVEDTTRFYESDMINVSDRTLNEKNIISAITDENTLVLLNNFTPTFNLSLVPPFDDTVVQRVGYPDPIPLISARLAAANLYDKYFAAQSSPNISDYGTELRKQAEMDLNNVLNGRSRLMGQKILGRRFFNPTTLDRNEIGGGDKNRGNSL
jgi:hypothetical protein